MASKDSEMEICRVTGSFLGRPSDSNLASRSLCSGNVVADVQARMMWQSSSAAFLQ